MGYDGKYGKVTTENKVIPEDEPIFILRGQDILACNAVREYAELYFNVTGDYEGYRKIVLQARKMELWTTRKIPD